MIADHAVAIEDEGFRRPAGAELIGNLVLQILEDGKRQIQSTDLGADFGQVVLLVGVEADDRDSLVGQFGRKLLQPGGVELHQRAFGPGENDHQDRLVGEVLQRPFASAMVFEVQLGELAAQDGGRLRCRCDSGQR